MKRHSVTLSCSLLLCLVLTACASTETVPTAAPPDLVGYSGKVSPQAELLFSRARVLWRGSKASSVTAAVVCSNPKEALSLLDQAIELEPSYAEAYIWRGLAKSELGQREEAFGDATVGIRLHPSAEAYAYRALISMRGRSFSAAHKDIDYSLQLNPSQHRAWSFAGMLALLEGNSKLACENFANACSAGDCGPKEAAQADGLCK